MSDRHILVIEPSEVAAGSRHAWRLIVAGLTDWKKQYWARRRKSAGFQMLRLDGVVNPLHYLGNCGNRVLVFPILIFMVTRSTGVLYMSKAKKKTSLRLDEKR
jgi:hypothetical protein